MIVLALLLSVLSVWVIVLNWVAVVRGCLRLPTGSWIPLLWGVFGSCAIIPSGGYVPVTY